MASRRWVIARLHHGFGNQLFQAAWGVLIAKKLNAHLAFDTQWYDSASKASIRPCLLRKMPIRAHWLTTEQMEEIRKHLQHGPSGAWNRMASVMRRRALGLPATGRFRHVRSKETLGQWPNPQGWPQSHHPWLDGYWQDAQVAEVGREDLQQEFCLPAADPLGRPESTGIKVAVHVRRGDYLEPHNLSKHPCQSAGYFERAWRRLQQRVDQPIAEVRVASEDRKWVEENLGFLPNIRWIDEVTGGDPWLDFRALQACDHFIIANSSFSWWAAWLGQHPEKMVLMPSVWSGVDTSTAERLRLDSWEMIAS